MMFQAERHKAGWQVLRQNPRLKPSEKQARQRIKVSDGLMMEYNHSVFFRRHKGRLKHPNTPLQSGE
ncbi:hypothetical protein [Neisseria sp. CCUG12390]|uniref:hypothetical protein n=1 Tax=Neisseria sp. CCUG12390 TaxID=3392035 RepID=UPI003A0FD8C3